MKHIRWFFLLVATLVLVNCTNTMTSPTVARVDNIVLTRQDLDRRVAIAQSYNNTGTPPTPEQAKQFENSIIQSFIQQHMLMYLAKERGIEISEEEINTLIEQLRMSINNSGSISFNDAIRSQLAMEGENSSEFRQFVASMLARDKLTETMIATDTVRLELESTLMEQALAPVLNIFTYHILVADEAQAVEIIDQLNQGASFEDLAREYSEDPGSGANGGELGWIQQGQTVPEFEQAAFALEPGQYTQTPVQSQFGYHIIKVTEREERPSMTENEAQQFVNMQIEQELMQRRSQALQELLIAEQQKAEQENRIVQPAQESAP